MSRLQEVLLYSWKATTTSYLPTPFCVQLAEVVYDHLEIYQYAQKRFADVRRYIRSIDLTPGADYLFIADFDQGPCVTLRKSRLMTEYDNLDALRIVIVKTEIESWYLAGLDSHSCVDLRIQTLRDTNDVTKEQFDNIKSPHFEDRADFILEVLSRYDTETARDRNASFDYALDKYFSPSR